MKRKRQCSIRPRSNYRSIIAVANNTGIAVILIFLGLSMIANSHADVDPNWCDTFADASKIYSSTNVALKVTEFGRDFTRYAGNPLSTLITCDPWDGPIPGVVHPSVLYFPEGMDGYEFWLVCTPYWPGQVSTWEWLTLVRSHDGVNWEKTDDYTNPLFGPGPETCASDPELVYTEDKGWFLYHSGAPHHSVMVATSTDGKHYTRYGGYGGSPIVNQAVPEGPTVLTRAPSVIYDGTTFHMWYGIGYNDIGYATSTDGLNWDLYAGNPVLSPTPGSWESASISHQDVIYHDGMFWMYYHGSDIGQATSMRIGLATSTDGITWTKHAGNPILAMVPGTWESGSLYHASPIVVGDEMWLYYCGIVTATGVATQGTSYNIGLAKSKDEGYVVLEEVEVEPTEYPPRPGDTIAWYRFDEGGPSPPSFHEYLGTTDTRAWYHFNEGSGITATDSSENENAGTLYGATWTTGTCDYGLEFDGNDKVTVSNDDTLNPTDAITIEAWVNPTAHKPNNYIVSKFSSDSSQRSYGLKLDSSHASSEIWAWVGHGGAHYRSFSTDLVPTGKWTHVAMTYSASDPDHVVRIFMDGIEVSCRVQEPVPEDYLINVSGAPLNIGFLPVVDLYFEGLMDEVRILGKALTPEEIADDAYSGPPDVIDSSGNENHGSVVGGVAWTTGKFSHGLDFDGLSGHVFVPFSPSLNTADEVTIEAWVNPDVTRENNYLVSRFTGYPNAAYGLKVNSTGIVGWIYHTEEGITGKDALFRSKTTIVPPPGTWSFVAMTYKSSEKKVRLYCNGEEASYSLQMEVPGDGHIDTPTDVPLLIGKLHYPDDHKYLDGKLDEVRVLNRALSASEILADYGGGYIYNSPGSLTSEVIQPQSFLDLFFAHDTCPAGTSITYSILNEAGETLIPSISSAEASTGFDISSLMDTPIRLHGELATTDPRSTPKLLDWSVTFRETPPDVTPPTTDITLAGILGLNGWYVSDVTVTLTATDDISGVASTQYSFDGATWIMYAGPFTITTEGTTTVYYHSTDNVDNVEETKSETVSIDKTAPVVTIASPAEGYYNTPITLTYTVTDNLDLNPTITGPSTGTVYSAEGVYSITITATDAAGNTDSASVEFTIDTTPPTLDKLLSGTEGNHPWWTSDVTVTLTALDDTSGVDNTEYSFDGSTWTTYSGPFDISTEGTTTLYHRVTDKAGLTYELPNQEIKIDKTPPAVTLTPDRTPDHNGWYNNPVTWIVSATDDTSGVASSDDPITYSGPDSATASVTGHATDAAGNTGSSTVTFQYDATAPTLTKSLSGTSGLDGWYVSNVDVTLNGDDATPGSGLDRVEYKIGSGSWTTYNGEIEISDEGTSVLYHRAFDFAGNEYELPSQGIRIDKTPPTTTLAIGAPQFTSGTDVYVTSDTAFTLSPSDNLEGSGVDKTYYSIDNENGLWTEYSGSFNIPVANPDGICTVYYYSTDIAGNIESEKTEEVILDNTAPTTTLNIGEPRYEDSGDIFVTSATTFTLTHSDGDGSGVASTECRVDMGSWTPYIDPFTLASSDGPHTIEYRSKDEVGNIESMNTQQVVLDDSAPSIEILVPGVGQALMDGVTLEAEVSDDSGSGVDWVKFSVREPDGDQGTIIDPTNPTGPPFELMTATNIVDDTWQLSFDTTQLPDGYYLALVEASDMLGNEGCEVAQFSIRNWAVLELLPASESNKAGRTMPVKFSLRIVETVDPAQPFVYNEELTIKIYQVNNPINILQESIYGETARDYRIDSDGEHYITNFKTLKTPALYIVEIYRNANDFLIGWFTFETVR